MKLHAITMVRTDADIWPSWLTHHLPLFDRLIVVDHQSVDGTLEITRDAIAAGKPIDLLHYRHEGYWQNAISNATARRSFAAGADWVFFIDADEFLAIKNRRSLERLLYLRQAVRFSWLNLIPTTFGSFVEFELNQPFQYKRDLLRWARGVPKIAISKTIARRFPNFRVDSGNHTVRKDDGHRLVAWRSGTLLHIPIRSRDRLWLKAYLGAASQGAVNAGLRSYGHWNRMLERITAAPDDDDLLRQIAFDYGKSPKENSSARPSLPRAQPSVPVGIGVFAPHFPENASHGQARSLNETLRMNEALVWEPSPATVGGAEIEGDELVLVGEAPRVTRR